MFKGLFRGFLLFITFIVVVRSYGQELASRDTTVRKEEIRHVVGFPAILHSPELSWALGGAGSYYFKFSHKDSLIRTSFIQGLGIATLRKQLVFAFDASIFFPNEALILRIHGSVSRFPDRFWGLGNYSHHDDQEPYTISQYYIFPQLLRQVYRKFYVGVAYESQNVFNFQYGHGKPPGQSIFDLQNVRGRFGGSTSGIGLMFLWDSRNNAFSSSKGFYFQYYVNEFSKALGSNFHYISHILDMRKYLTLSDDKVIAMQFMGHFNRGDVPVRSMANIGSSSIMRGYYDGRFTDKNLMAFQTEYRQHVYKRLGYVVFAGIGRVATKFSDFQFTGLKLRLVLGYDLQSIRKKSLMRASTSVLDLTRAGST